MRDRITAAGLSDERIEEHISAGRVRVDGELVTNLGHFGSGGDAGRGLGIVNAPSMHMAEDEAGKRVRPRLSGS